MNNKPSADNVGDEVAALYMPTEVRMVVTLVSPGGEYVPPTPTGEETTTTDDTTTTSDTNGDISGDDDATASPGTSTANDETTTSPAGTTAQSTGPDTPSTDATDPTELPPGDPDGCVSGGRCSELTGDPDTTGTTAGPPATTDDEASGCACSSTPSGAPGDLASLLLLTALPRRRRRPR